MKRFVLLFLMLGINFSLNFACEKSSSSGLPLVQVRFGREGLLMAEKRKGKFLFVGFEREGQKFSCVRKKRRIRNLSVESSWWQCPSNVGKKRRIPLKIILQIGKKRHLFIFDRPELPELLLDWELRLDSFLPVNPKNPYQTQPILLVGKKRRLLVATADGRILLLNAHDGRILLKGKIAEGYAKQALFSFDESSFYLAEQARDGFLYRFEKRQKGLVDVWRFRLADELGTVRSLFSRDPYAWTRYPGAYKLDFLDEHHLLLAGVRSWYAKGSHSLSRLYAIEAKSGRILWRWPSQRASQALFTWFALSPDRGRIALLASAPNSGLKQDIGGLYLLDSRGILLAHRRFSPYRPFFRGVGFWRGVIFSPDGRRIAVTTNDGRLFVMRNAPSLPLLWKRRLVAPFFVSGTPLTTSVGPVLATRKRLLVLTGTSFFLRAASTALNHPPVLHPQAQSLFIFDWLGKMKAQLPLEAHPQAAAFDGKRRWLAIAVSGQPRGGERPHSSVMLFRLFSDGRVRLVASYRLKGRIPYGGLSFSEDGRRLAILQQSWRTHQGQLIGHNKILLLR